MSYVCTKFLSHEDKDLVEHLLEVGKKSKEIYCQSKFENHDLAYYAGLLHDVGKINPYYQLIFHKENTNDIQKYLRRHSVFSAWATSYLLRKRLDRNLVDKITMLVYGHHTELKNHPNIHKDKLFEYTYKEITTQMPQLFDIMKKSGFPDLNWAKCEKEFQSNIRFDLDFQPKEYPKDFLDMSYAFSCLLQADRGSFDKWNVPKFDLTIDTKQHVRKNSILGNVRNSFQSHVLGNFDINEPIQVISAPTGIGKTKAFLDIVQRHKGKVERVFYFSPLLALTEDFERKLHDSVSSSEQNDILIYNYLHSKSLLEKNDSEFNEKYVFIHESFNKKFIVTTTQRLLMTIFSNKHRDKIKFASLKNSLLIIDEVQTIPKPILSNLIPIFKTMSECMSTSFLLVSATIPKELHEIKHIKLPKESKQKYLEQTKKSITFQNELDLAEIHTGKVLVMANTRKKASDKFLQIQKEWGKRRKIMYMSTGIRKKDRTNILYKLDEESDYILVATQVVEAGVDVSFSQIFREEAPLDNIIQVMGRLNREGKDENAGLFIYRTDEKPIPYSPLEYEITKEKIKGITNSIQIYDMLDQYYEEISNKNRSNAEKAEKLKRLISKMDFENVWKLVKELISDEYGHDTVIIPDDKKDWERVKNSILSILKYNKENKDKNKIFKKFGDLTALLPVHPNRIGIEKFDEELKAEHILFPKKEYLEEIYDSCLGLDKWLSED